MTLDREDHRAILLQLVDQSAFPGKFAEEVIALKKALADATVIVEASDYTAVPARKRGNGTEKRADR